MNPSSKKVFWPPCTPWNSFSVHGVAVSLPCNMWRFYGALDLAREGIKTWKWQVPWWAINWGGNISNADAPGINKYTGTSQASITHADTTDTTKVLNNDKRVVFLSIDLFWGTTTQNIVPVDWMINAEQIMFQGDPSIQQLGWGV